jgi:hypothetical protein
MTDIEAVCDAIAANIIAGMAGDAIAGRTFSIATDSINPPTAIVVPAPGEFLMYDDTFGGTSNYDIVVKILNGTQDAPASQTKLMGYMKKSGATSIRAAILSDVKLGGIVSYIEVPAALSYHNVEWSAQLFLGFELSVKVFE